MSIWERLARVARSELSEMKRVLSEKDDPTAPDAGRPETPEEARHRAIREAEAELARAERDVLAAQFEMGSSAWGDSPAGVDPDLDRGASIWARAGSETAATPITVAPSGPVVQAGWQGPPTAPKQPVVEVSRPVSPETPPTRITSAPEDIPRDVREAYAALELALGANAEAVQTNHAKLTDRFHPDRFGTDPERLRIAQLVRSRIDAARDVVLAWLGRN